MIYFHFKEIALRVIKNIHGKKVPLSDREAQVSRAKKNLNEGNLASHNVCFKTTQKSFRAWKVL